MCVSSQAIFSDVTPVATVGVLTTWQMLHTRLWVFLPLKFLSWLSSLEERPQGQ